MTHRLGELASLLVPERLYSPSELRRDPSQIPIRTGVYSWWFSEIPSNVPIEGTLRVSGHIMLYVGIAPRKPSKDGAHSSGTLRSRLMNHCRGPIASSTLRRTLTALLASDLALSFVRLTSGKLALASDGERKLSSWLDQNAKVCWLIHSEPWQLENELIGGTVLLPLNIRGSRSPFAASLSRSRSRMGMSNEKP